MGRYRCARDIYVPEWVDVCMNAIIVVKHPPPITDLLEDQVVAL